MMTNRVAERPVKPRDVIDVVHSFGLTAPDCP